MPRALQHMHRVAFQIFQAVLAQRTIDASGLAEAAAADAAALNFQHNAILRHFQKGDNRVFNVGSLVHLRDQLLANRGGNAGFIGRKRGDRVILMIGDVIKLRDVDTGQFCCRQQKVPAVPTR